MSLKTIVKVGRITNLSDARYCSGMGVDMLGFRVIEGQENYVSPKQFQEIRGWVTGPQIVAEIYGIEKETDLAEIISQYRPDYLEAGSDELKILKASTLPTILSLKTGEPSPLGATPDFFLVSDSSVAMDLPAPVLLQTSTKDAIDQALNIENIKGLALSGSQEIKPGLKDYEVLAEILESLETED